MKIKTSFRRIARPAGGLHVGVRYSFPVRLYQDVPPLVDSPVSPTGHRWTQQNWTERTLTMGLFAWELRFDFQTDFSKW